MTTLALTVNGSSVSMDATDTIPLRMVPYSRSGIATLTLQRRAIALPAPDTWVGKSVSFAINGTTYFSGRIVDRHASFQNVGWCLDYQCEGLRGHGDRVPFTDSNTGKDVAAFNLMPDDPAYIPSRAGRNVGQILTLCLLMTQNAINLNAYGIGQYTGLPTTPALPSATVSDLALMTILPPRPVYVHGEKLLESVEAVLSECAPNHVLYVQGDGTLRFLDQRTFSTTNYEMGVDPIEAPPLSRSTSECFQRVMYRGQFVTQPIMVATLPIPGSGMSNGGLVEDFGHDGLSSAAAKAAWKPSDASSVGNAYADGTCTCPGTTSVTVTCSDATRAWISDYWDQTSTGASGVIQLTYPAAVDITQQVTRRVVANTALTAGGTSTLTLDLPLPSTNYSAWRIYGLKQGANVVWRKYGIVNTYIAAAMQNMFTYPVPYIASTGASASMTSFPVGTVLWSNTNPPTAPYNEFPLGFTADPVGATLLFTSPTYFLANNAPPHEVRALLAVATDPLTAVSPADGGSPVGPVYAGTSHTVDGLTDTLLITVPEWRDPGNLANMQAAAADRLDAVKDAVVEGSITYYGLVESVLTMGTAVTISGTEAGSTFTTGWETITSNVTYPGLPIVEVELEFPQDGGNLFVTRMYGSNRRSAFAAADFLRPDRTTVLVGGEFDGLNAASSAFAQRQVGDSMTGQSSQPSHHGYEGSDDPYADAESQYGDMMGGQEQGASEAYGGAEQGANEAWSGQSSDQSSQQPADDWGNDAQQAVDTASHAAASPGPTQAAPTPAPTAAPAPMEADDGTELD